MSTHIQDVALLGLGGTAESVLLIGFGHQGGPVPVPPAPARKVFQPIRTTAPPPTGCVNGHCPPQYFVADATYTAISGSKQFTAHTQAKSLLSVEVARSIAMTQAKAQAEAGLKKLL